MTTFSEVLAARLRTDPGQPLLTFYDHETGERTELSVTTYANWVAKAAGLLADECDLERGDRLRLDLRPHWLAPVFAGAAWTLGLSLTAGDDPDAVVCGPESLGRWAAEAHDRVVLACSLLPMGVRFAEPVPPGVRDVGVEIWAQPDAFTPWDPPTGEQLAFDAAPGDDSPLSQAALMEAAATGSLLTDGGRLVSVADPASPPRAATFTEPLARGGSLVLVSRPDPARFASTYADERGTHAQPPRS